MMPTNQFTLKLSERGCIRIRIILYFPLPKFHLDSQQIFNLEVSRHPPIEMDRIVNHIQSLWFLVKYLGIVESW